MIRSRGGGGDVLVTSASGQEMQRDWEVGRLVGRYMVHHRIAAGGMATVHVGCLLGAAGFSRTVAIKRLHDDYARDPEFVAMLLDEARLASTIRHPNVVPTLDVVAEQDELLVVMEYVEGDSLARLQQLALAARERIPFSLAASLVAQVLHGLHAAHEARDKNGAPLDIVHRDVSPQNILVGTDGLARVLDFGIAKAASRASATADGQVKGKTAYMAPEQLQHGSVDRRTDVFAAAIVFWELLAGRRLFLGDSPSETIGRVLHQPIDSPQRWSPDVPIELALVTMRGLERDPGGRFATAEEMALAIEDASALPRAKEIGAWVSRVAASSIATRAEIVREVERGPHPMPAASTRPALREAMDAAERRRQMAEQPTDLGRQPAHGSGEGPAQPAPATPIAPSVGPHPIAEPRHTPFGDEPTDVATVIGLGRVSRAPVIGAVAGGLGLAAVVIVAFLSTRDRGPRASVEAPTHVVAAAEAKLASDRTSAPNAASAVVQTPPPATVEAPVSVSAAPYAPTFGKRRLPHRGNGDAKPDCRIPYVVDDRGLKHFKVECL